MRMSDESGSLRSQNQRSWFERLSHALHREPQDREQLFELLRDAEHRHLLDVDALNMIEGVLEVFDLQVRDIMVPRSQMKVIDEQDSLADFLPIIIDSGHSRFPVIGENRDEVSGILFAKDLLRCFGKNNDEFDLKNFLRKAVFVPESKRVDVLLKEFRKERNHMAIVVDEYGGVSGLVTIEDVLELIVGDIEDEHDITEADYITKTTEKTYIINALTPIEEFNEYFNANFSDEEFDTMGGLITHSFGYLPKLNETVIIEKYQFRVINADKRRIKTFEATLLE